MILGIFRNIITFGRLKGLQKEKGYGKTIRAVHIVFAKCKENFC